MSNDESRTAEINSVYNFVSSATPLEIDNLLARISTENRSRTSVRTNRDPSNQTAPTQFLSTTSSSQEQHTSSPISSSSSGSTTDSPQTIFLPQDQISTPQLDQYPQGNVSETLMIPLISLISNFIDPSIRFSPATQKQLTHFHNLLASLVADLYSDRTSTASVLRSWPFIFHPVLELIVASLNVDWQKINLSQGNFHSAAVEITSEFEQALPRIFNGSIPTSFLSNLVRKQAEDMIKKCRKQNYYVGNPYKNNKYGGKYANKDQNTDNKYKINTFRNGGGRQGGNPVGTPTPPSIVLHQQADGSWRT